MGAVAEQGRAFGAPNSEIERVAKNIHDRKARRLRLVADVERADRVAGGHAANLRIDRAQGVVGSDNERLHAAAMRELEAAQAALRALDEELTDLHEDAMPAAWRRYAFDVIGVTVPPAPTTAPDAELEALERAERGVLEKLASTHAQTETQRQALADAQADLRRQRVAILRGQAKKGSDTALAARVTEIDQALTEQDAAVGDLTSALDAIHEDRARRQAVIAEQIVPELRAEEARRFDAFLAAFRAVVAAGTALDDVQQQLIAREASVDPLRFLRGHRHLADLRLDRVNPRETGAGRWLFDVLAGLPQ